MSTYVRVIQQYKRLEFKVYDYLIFVKSFSSTFLEIWLVLYECSTVCACTWII